MSKKTYQVAVMVRYTAEVEAESEEEAYAMGWDIIWDENNHDTVLKIEVTA